MIIDEDDDEDLEDEDEENDVVKKNDYFVEIIVCTPKLKNRCFETITVSGSADKSFVST